jgi:CheY-like chemotaxis protein
MSAYEGQTPEAELDDLHDFLVHLYDYEYLRQHDLLAWVPVVFSSSGEGRVGLVRATVLATIEALGPPDRGRFRAAASRSYSVLNLHYVEGLTVQEVALELAVSERQVYRDLKKAERDLAVLLCERVAAAPEAEAIETRAELLDREVERAGESSTHLAVKELLEGARSAVARLAASRAIHVDISAQEATFQAQRVLVRQTILVVLSQVLELMAPKSTLAATGRVDGEQLVLTISFPPSDAAGAGDDAHRPYRLPHTAEHLVARLGGTWDARQDDDGRIVVALRLGRSLRTSVLVIDDHQGMAELFRRYLWGEPYDVFEAATGEDGVRLAETFRPEIVVLDVMMPDQDGWEVLQRLQSYPATRDMPVIICSVLEQPSLARSLGAVDYIAKPVTRDRLLQVLQRYR